MLARIAPLFMAALVLALPAVASADELSDHLPKTICVTQLYPAQPAGCDAAQPFSRDGLQQALDTANTVTTFRGDDTIKLDAGTIAIDSGFSITSTAQVDHGAVHIVGAGIGQTVIGGGSVAEAGSFIPLTLNLVAAPTSSISGLTIDVGGTITSWTGLRLDAGTIENVRFNVIGGQESMHTGLNLTGNGVTVKSSSLKVVGEQAIGIQANGWDLKISDSELFAPEGSFALMPSLGIVSAGKFDGRRLEFDNVLGAINYVGQQFRLIDSLIRLRSLDLTASGIHFDPNVPSATALLQGVTIVGGGPGVKGLIASSSSGASDVDVKDSLFDLASNFEPEISCTSSFPATTLTVEHSMLAGVAGTCASLGAGNIMRAMAPPPLYVNGAAGDYRPAASSPVIDAGSTDATREDPKVDLAGLPRFVDGDGNGSVVADIGAFEFQRDPPPSSAPPAPSAADHKVVFGKATARFRFKPRRKLRNGFVVTRRRPKGARIPVTSTFDGPIKVKLTLQKGRKRLKGSQRLTIPAGRSFIVFRGRWNRRVLKTGRYKLRAVVGGATTRIAINVRTPLPDPYVRRR